MSGTPVGVETWQRKNVTVVGGEKTPSSVRAPACDNRISQVSSVAETPKTLLFLIAFGHQGEGHTFKSTDDVHLQGSTL